MAKGHCELVCDSYIVGAESCVNYVNAATRDFPWPLVIYYAVISKLLFYILKKKEVSRAPTGVFRAPNWDPAYFYWLHRAPTPAKVNDVNIYVSIVIHQIKGN